MLPSILRPLRRLRLGATFTSVTLVTLGALGCGGAPRCPETAPPPTLPTAARARIAPTAPAPGTPKKPDDASRSPRLTISLTPDPRTAAVVVEITAAADPSALMRWSIPAASADGGAGVFHLAGFRDDSGPLAAELIARPNQPLSVSLARLPIGELHARYTLDGKPRRAPLVPALDVGPDRFQASGEALLLLPDGLDDRQVRASIRIVTDSYGTEEDLGELVAQPASSFGVGAAREVTTRGRELRLGAYLAGHMGRALFDTHEGHDEAAWFGYTAFDPRPISADVAAFRTAAHEIFHDKSREPMTLLIVADERQPGSFVAARRAQSVLVHVGVNEPWSSPVRIAVAAEVLHAWIGGQLWVGPTDAEHEAEATWFTEGVTRQLARDLLFRFGLISPSDVLDELHGLASVVATSARRAESNAALAAHRREPGVLPLLVARGALYAARVDARLRKKSGDKRRLDDVLRTLLDEARAQRAALPTSAWLAAVTRELDASEGAAFTEAIEKGGPIEIPEGAFGPCFRGEKRRYEAFELGFDEDATRAAPTRAIEGLKPGGPAERAGLRRGDVLIEAVMKRGRTDSPVTLTIERDGARKTITYKPVGATATAGGWARKKDVPDEACSR